MLPHQKIELGIYKRVKTLEPGAVTMTLPMLTQETGEDHATIAERLKGLEADRRIALFKYSGGSRWPHAQFGDDDKTFFHTGSFLIEVTPQGRKYFEELEQLASEEAQKRLVFISCGQCAPQEKQLGKGLAARVNELTSWEGYFAEDQNSLSGLSNHIFRALEECVAFVAVMHHRGEVETLGGQKHTRASIWIEQEIAIAAFLTATRSREIPVLLYIQRGIKREGVREQLKLSPIEFDEEAEVLADFVSRLKSGTFKSLAHRTKLPSDGQQEAAKQLRARGEELHSLVTQWLNMMGGAYLRRNGVMQGKLTYNQCLDLDISEGRAAKFDFSRIELLIDVDFPSMRGLYDKIIAERTKLHKIESAFRRSWENGEKRGEEFLPRYVEVQRSIEALGESFQKQILGCIRATGA